MLGCPFIGLGGSGAAGRWRGTGGGGGGAMMVVEAAISGGDRQGWWWGVMRGVLRPFWERKGAPGGGARAREAVVATSVIWPGEEDDRTGPACRRERAGRTGGAGQGSRPSDG
jgi:hypothetical protein